MAQLAPLSKQRIYVRAFAVTIGVIGGGEGLR
jgi:hypothetical protein